jgi:hypothetical protein
LSNAEAGGCPARGITRIVFVIFGMILQKQARFKKFISNFETKIQNSSRLSGIGAGTNTSWRVRYGD